MNHKALAGLERVFHEPARLGILSLVSAECGGVSFNDLKALLELTDGNLNRHLKVLREAGVVRVKRVLANDRPKSLVFLTDEGRHQFLQYLQSLEEVLLQASRNLGSKDVSHQEGGLRSPLKMVY